ncbi:MAG: hypothetical protein QE271_09675, partial [Bacteriovoracaceae bacterium]|nr:hypothetical protein [Bacteriovoracaceae bacterium]
SKRALTNDQKNKIIVIGPILNGKFINFPKNKVKTEHLTIAMFDLTPMKVRIRTNFGEGPFCSIEQQTNFYQAALSLFENFPDIRIIMKTKRSENHQIFDYVDSYKKFIKIKSSRIIFDRANGNPYQTLSKANLVISVPFTSPTMLALSFGIPAVYYDPINLCTNTFQNVFQDITIKSEAKLFDYIKNFNSYDVKNSAFPAITPEDIIKNLKKRL